MTKVTLARIAILAATVSGAALLHPAAAKADEAACASLSERWGRRNLSCRIRLS